MFNLCISATSLNIKIDTSEVTNMSSMFVNCYSLKTLDISDINTKNVLDMFGIFQNCNSLTSLDLSKLSTDKVINMSYIFKFFYFF